MPQEDRWEAFFDPEDILSKLGLDPTCQAAVEKS